MNKFEIKVFELLSNHREKIINVYQNSVIMTIFFVTYAPSLFIQ